MSTAREQLAEVLRQARIDGGFGSHGALARKLNVSRPVVTRAENPAHPVPSDAVLAAWAGATGVGLDVVRELAARAKSGTPDWFMLYRQAEAAADTVRCWSPVQVPGLLQAESYARETLAVEPYPAGRLAELLAARMERQVVIGRAYVTAVIDQHVLERPIGSPAVMAEQCARLGSLAERADIALHVIPEGTNMGLWGGFDLATRDNVTTVCLTAIEDITSTAGNLVAMTMQAFERLLGAALPRAASLDRVRVAEETWNKQI
jgi:transcriptional regulator with XRE-family HTH domain